MNREQKKEDGTVEPGGQLCSQSFKVQYSKLSFISPQWAYKFSRSILAGFMNGGA